MPLVAHSTGVGILRARHMDYAVLPLLIKIANVHRFFSADIDNILRNILQLLSAPVPFDYLCAVCGMLSHSAARRLSV